MVSVPSFLLRKLYVKGSLKNTDEGFQFQLRNSLGSGYAHKMMALEVDDRILDITNCFFGKMKNANALTRFQHLILLHLR